MEADIQMLLDALRDLRKEANVNACFGEPVTYEHRSVIPIAKVGYAFGMGAGQGPMSEPEMVVRERDGQLFGGGGGGGAGGLTSFPLGVVEVASQGVRIKPIIDLQKVAVIGLLVGAWSVFWLARALTAIFGRRG